MVGELEKLTGADRHPEGKKPEIPYTDAKE